MVPERKIKTGKWLDVAGSLWPVGHLALVNVKKIYIVFMKTSQLSIEVLVLTKPNLGCLTPPENISQPDETY